MDSNDNAESLNIISNHNQLIDTLQLEKCLEKKLEKIKFMNQTMDDINQMKKSKEEISKKYQFFLFLKSLLKNGLTFDDIIYLCDYLPIDSYVDIEVFVKELITNFKSNKFEIIGLNENPNIVAINGNTVYQIDTKSYRRLRFSDMMFFSAHNKRVWVDKSFGSNIISQIGIDSLENIINQYTYGDQPARFLRYLRELFPNPNNYQKMMDFLSRALTFSVPQRIFLKTDMREELEYFLILIEKTFGDYYQNYLEYSKIQDSVLQFSNQDLTGKRLAIFKIGIMNTYGPKRKIQGYFDYFQRKQIKFKKLHNNLKVIKNRLSVIYIVDDSVSKDINQVIHLKKTNCMFDMNQLLQMSSYFLAYLLNQIN